ncbi:MAG: amidohydrolase family protein [Proteobacteria bacterium]|nr:amidohydrolase family protein [Pseudomonadota bacterium]
MTNRREFNLALLGSAVSACIAPLAGCSSVQPIGPEVAIDCHAHVFLRDLPMPDRRRAPSGYDAPPQDYLRILAANAVTHGVLVQPSFLGTDNSYLVAALGRFPSQLRGIAVVEPSVTGAQLDQMQHAGVVGIRLNLIGLPTPDFSSAQWVRLLKEVRQRNWQVEVHQVAGKLKPVLEPLLAADLNVVVDHFGRPDAKDGVDDPGFEYLLTLGATRRVWVKLSGAYRNGASGRGEMTAKAAMPLLRKAFGLDRLIWGSDWPHTLFETTVNYSNQLRLLDEWVPDHTERQIVLRDTPAKLFQFVV